MSEYVKNIYETYVSLWMTQINGDKNKKNALRILPSKETVK